MLFCKSQLETFLFWKSYHSKQLYSCTEAAAGNLWLWHLHNCKHLPYRNHVSLVWTFAIRKHEAAGAAKLLQSCPILCDPREGTPPGSLVPGILQAKTLEWVAISFSNASKWKVKVKSLSRVWLWATPWTAAHQAPLSMGFSRQEYWIGLPLPSLGNMKEQSQNDR